MVSIIGQCQINAYGEISTLTPPQHTIEVNGTSFIIPYNITGGTVTLIQADTNIKTVDVSVQSSNGGSLTITLPMALIDAYQGSDKTHLVITNKNHGIQYTSVETLDDRTLTIPLSVGSSTIEIKGTYMIPEFGSLASIILVIAVISIIAVSQNSSKSYW
jgi:predicted secreted protein with PEFG-CTERM motif